jgi:hypothetical protein
MFLYILGGAAPSRRRRVAAFLAVFFVVNFLWFYEPCKNGLCFSFSESKHNRTAADMVSDDDLTNYHEPDLVPKTSLTVTITTKPRLVPKTSLTVTITTKPRPLVFSDTETCYHAGYPALGSEIWISDSTVDSTTSWIVDSSSDGVQLRVDGTQLCISHMNGLYLWRCTSQHTRFQSNAAGELRVGDQCITLPAAGAGAAAIGPCASKGFDLPTKVCLCGACILARGPLHSYLCTYSYYIVSPHKLWLVN